MKQSILVLDLCAHHLIWASQRGKNIASQFCTATRGQLRGCNLFEAIEFLTILSVAHVRLSAIDVNLCFSSSWTNLAAFGGKILTTCRTFRRLSCEFAAHSSNRLSLAAYLVLSEAGEDRNGSKSYLEYLCQTGMRRSIEAYRSRRRPNTVQEGQHGRRPVTPASLEGKQVHVQTHHQSPRGYLLR